jgi:hypothetical protein
MTESVTEISSLSGTLTASAAGADRKRSGMADSSVGDDLSANLSTAPISGFAFSLGQILDGHRRRELTVDWCRRDSTSTAVTSTQLSVNARSAASMSRNSLGDGRLADATRGVSNFRTRVPGAPRPHANTPGSTTHSTGDGRQRTSTSSQCVGRRRANDRAEDSDAASRSQVPQRSQRGIGAHATDSISSYTRPKASGMTLVGNEHILPHHLDPNAGTGMTSQGSDDPIFVTKTFAVGEVMLAGREDGVDLASFILRLPVQYGQAMGDVYTDPHDLTSEGTAEPARHNSAFQPEESEASSNKVADGSSAIQVSRAVGDAGAPHGDNSDTGNKSRERSIYAVDDFRQGVKFAGRRVPGATSELGAEWNVSNGANLPNRFTDIGTATVPIQRSAIPGIEDEHPGQGRFGFEITLRAQAVALNGSGPKAPELWGTDNASRLESPARHAAEPDGSLVNLPASSGAIPGGAEADVHGMSGKFETAHESKSMESLEVPEQNMVGSTVGASSSFRSGHNFSYGGDGGGDGDSQRDASSSLDGESGEGTSGQQVRSEVRTEGWKLRVTSSFATGDQKAFHAGANISTGNILVAQGSSPVSSIRDTPTADIADVVLPEVGLDLRHEVHPPSARSISLRVDSDAGGEPVQLRFQQRGEQLDVRMTSGSEAMAQEIREHLPQLLARLNQVGYHTERITDLQTTRASEEESTSHRQGESGSENSEGNGHRQSSGDHALGEDSDGRGRNSASAELRYRRKGSSFYQFLSRASNVAPGSDAHTQTPMPK